MNLVTNTKYKIWDQYKKLLNNLKDSMSYMRIIIDQKKYLFIIKWWKKKIMVLEFF